MLPIAARNAALASSRLSDHRAVWASCASRMSLIVSWNQYPAGRGAHKVHLTTGNTLNRMIRVLVVRDAFVQPSLHRTGSVRAFEEERSHCASCAAAPGRVNRAEALAVAPVAQTGRVAQCLLPDTGTCL
jgi:hypothetical protein